MLTASRSLIPRCRRCSWRSLSTEAQSSSSWPFQADRERVSHPESIDSRRPTVSRYGDQTAYVRASKIIPSMADGFAIARALELKYGRVQEFKFLRDWENRTAYQTVLYAVFADPASMDLIPPEGDSIQVPCPELKNGQQGDVGLDDMHHLLFPRNRDVNHDDTFSWRSGGSSSGGRDATPSRRTIDITVLRTSHSSRPAYYAVGEDRRVITRDTKVAFGHNFVEFGGFYEPPQAPADKTDRPYMNDAIAKWKRIINLPQHAAERNRAAAVETRPNKILSVRKKVTVETQEQIPEREPVSVMPEEWVPISPPTSTTTRATVSPSPPPPSSPPHSSAPTQNSRSMTKRQRILLQQAKLREEQQAQPMDEQQSAPVKAEQKMERSEKREGVVGRLSKLLGTKWW